MADNPKDVGIWVGAGTAVLLFFGALWKTVKMMVSGDIDKLSGQMKALSDRMVDVEKKHETMANQRTADMASVQAELSKLGIDLATVTALNKSAVDSLGRIESVILRKRRN